MRDDDSLFDISEIGSQCGNMEDVLEDINGFPDRKFGKTVEDKD